MPEPEREASGYRRYSAQAAVHLSAITDIDAELQRKIDQLTDWV